MTGHTRNAPFLEKSSFDCLPSFPLFHPQPVSVRQTDSLRRKLQITIIVNPLGTTDRHHQPLRPETIHFTTAKTPAAAFAVLISRKSRQKEKETQKWGRYLDAAMHSREKKREKSVRVSDSDYQHDTGSQQPARCINKKANFTEHAILNCVAKVKRHCTFG